MGKADSAGRAATPTDEPKTFNTIISSLRSSYPQDKMSEISTSFCFICLLHLANEEGLRIETARFDGLDGEDVGCKGLLEEGTGRILESPRKGKSTASDDKRDRTVGELQALRVYKVCRRSLVRFALSLRIRRTEMRAERHEAKRDIPFTLELAIHYSHWQQHAMYLYRCPLIQ